jgi:putative membrane-bound dehydrogenase-like protein
MRLKALPRLVITLLIVSLSGVLSSPAADAKKNQKRPTAPAAPVPGAPDHVPPALLHAPKGLEVTLWAKSPMLRNPTNIDIDQHGRIWVAEGANYRNSKRDPLGDRIVVLEDRNGAGKANRSWTFVQETNLVSPLGVAVFDNVVVVSQPPDLIVYTDVNRNQVFDKGVDKREVLLSGFNGRNHDHSLHAVVGGPDGKWYWNQGNTGGKFTDKSGKTFQIGSPYGRGFGTNALDKAPPEYAGFKSDDGHVWVSGFAARMNADGSKVEIVGHGFRNSYEQVVTSFGDIFQNDNDDPPACRTSFLMEYGFFGFCSPDGQRSWRVDQRPGQTTAIAEWRQEDPGVIPAGDVYGGGAPTGIAYYENGALLGESDGLLLSCDTGRNMVFGYRPKAKGAGFELERFNFLTSNPEGKFAGSDFIGGNNTAKAAQESLPTQFRPSDVCVGPDGAIYVSDWFDPRTGGHSTLDGGLYGAIYRITPAGFRQIPPSFNLKVTRGQIAALQSPAVNVRWTGFNLLKAQGEKVIPDVLPLLRDRDSHIAARALWLLPQLGAPGVKLTEKELGSGDARRRLVAFRALRAAGLDVLPHAKRLAADPNDAVRRDVAIALRNVPFTQSKDVLVAIARKGEKVSAADPWLTEAIGNSAKGNEAALYDALVNPKVAPVKWSPPFEAMAWRLHPPQSVPAFAERALTNGLPLTARKRAVTALAFAGTKDAVNVLLDVAQKADGAVKAEALWWLLNRKDDEWKAFSLDDALKSRRIYDPASVELTASTMPDAVTPKAPTKEEVLALKGNAKNGLELTSRCTMCHRIGNEGYDVGPDLTAFGSSQPLDVLVQAILEPSADISHGYDAQVITTKNNLRIEGLVLTDKNPVVMLSVGGLTQMIPRNQIASKTPLGRSLMWTPQALGLTAQDVADLAAYLRSLKP